MRIGTFEVRPPAGPPRAAGNYFGPLRYEEGIREEAWLWVPTKPLYWMAAALRKWLLKKDRTRNRMIHVISEAAWNGSGLPSLG